MAEAGGQQCACALSPGAAGGRRGGGGRGADRSAAELLPPLQPPPQRRGHVVWCVGRGKEEEGVKPREETGERHHTHGTRWPERQQLPELSGVWSRPRGLPRPAGSCTRAVRRPAGAKRPRMRRGGRCSGSEPASEAPGAAGPATPKAPLRQRPRRLPGARAARAGAGGRLGWAARRGTRVRATRRCRSRARTR